MEPTLGIASGFVLEETTPGVTEKAALIPQVLKTENSR